MILKDLVSILWHILQQKGGSAAIHLNTAPPHMHTHPPQYITDNEMHMGA